MTAQLRINDRGELEPATWDGESLYSQDTVREGLPTRLFEDDPFAQIRGQLAIKEEDMCQRCSSPLDNAGYCTDETCPYSDHLQHERWTEE